MPQVGVAARSPKFLRGGCRAAGRFPSARCRSRATPPRRRMSGFRCRCAPTAAPRPSESHAASELRGKAVRLRLVCLFALAQVQRELRRSSPPRQEFHFMVTERGADTRGVPVMLQFTDASGGDISEELTMTKSILISLAVLTLSTSAALAAHRTHHRQAMNASASVGASPVIWMGGVSSSDRALYIKNLHDSGYNLKDNFSANGNIKG